MTEIPDWVWIVGLLVGGGLVFMMFQELFLLSHSNLLTNRAALFKVLS